MTGVDSLTTHTLQCGGARYSLAPGPFDPGPVVCNSRPRRGADTLASTFWHPYASHCVGACPQVITYAAKDRFKHLKNKTFKGHNTAGYACQVNFSPDNRFVLSGAQSSVCRSGWGVGGEG